MTIQYIIGTNDVNEMIKNGEIDFLQEIQKDKYEEIEINIDFEENKADAWGNKNGSSDLLNDSISIDLEALEERVFKKEIHEIWLDNVEIARYIEFFGVPFDWALEAVDEWRTDEDAEIIDEEIFDAVENIITAYKISREEN